MKDNVELATKVIGEGRLSAHSRRPFLGKDGNSYVLVQNANGEYGKLRVNGTALLQYDEWKDIDRAVVQAAVQRLRAVADLRSRGLEHNLGSIGVTISLWDRQSDMTAAELSMDARRRSEMDTPAFKTQQVPVPIVHKDFEIELRRLTASRRMGESLDVSGAQIAGRLVAEKTESMLFVGSTLISAEGSPIYGYTTHPDRNIVAMATNWTAVAAGDNYKIVNDVIAMQNASRTARHFGPWVLYVPTNFEGKLDQDYKDSVTSSDPRTVRDRILALSGIEDVVVADFLPASNVVLVQMTNDTIDLAVAQDVTTVQWSADGGMSEDFKVMAVWVPRCKSDFDGRCGITHLS